MTETAFTASNLGQAFGDVVALAGLDLSVPKGRTGLVGANGAGKSTLIKILLGILNPTEGSSSVLGMDTERDLVAIRSVIGYMPEGPCLPLDQTAADFLVYAAGTAGLPREAARQRASDVLTLVGLDEERFRYLGDFSTGMKQRAKLAQAIVHDPDLVFLDEPTSGLDPSGRDDMLDLIARLGTFGIDVVVSSHVLRDIERTCDWVVMLDEGRLLHSGPIGRYAADDAVRVELASDPAPMTETLQRQGASVRTEGSTLLVRSDADDVYRLIRDAAAANDATLRRLSGGGSTLEELFINHGDQIDGDQR